MAELKAHPVADLFPMLAAEELQELADDIKTRGLLQPIMVDAEGQILDGRNRLAACKLAGVEPVFEHYLGDDPDGYAVAVNVARRMITKGQKAMIIVEAGDNNYQAAGVSRQYTAWARTVKQYTPALVAAVIAGSLSLKDAYDSALRAKKEAEEHAEQMIALRAEAPDLAARVEDETDKMTVAEATTLMEARRSEEDKKRRDEEAQRRHEERTATHQLCDVVVTLSQMEDFDTGTKYNPEDALPGRAVTREILFGASRAIGQLIDIWEERNLP